MAFLWIELQSNLSEAARQGCEWKEVRMQVAIY